MEVQSADFQKVFVILRKKFIEKYKNDKTIKGIPGNSPQIWEANHKVNGVASYYATELFSGYRTTDPHYLRRTYETFIRKKLEKGWVDELTMLKALDFINDTYREDYSGIIKTEVPEKVEALLKQLLKSNVLFTKPENSNEYNDPTDSSEKPMATLQTFYNSLGSFKYAEAWALLAPEFQSRKPWYGDFEKFEIGFQNFRGTKNVTFFRPIFLNNDIFECHVFLENEVYAYTSKELLSFEAMTIGDIKAFYDAVLELDKKYLDKGLDIKKVELQKLFDPGASEYIWFMCGYDSKKVNELFNSQRTITVNRHFRCTCRLYNKEWLIYKIVGVRSYSSR